MKQRYRLFLRSNGGNFYLQDNLTGKQESLRTTDRAMAESLLHARNEAVRQPELNIQLARAYLAAGDPLSLGRNWQMVMDALVKTKSGVTQERYARATRDPAYDLIRKIPVLPPRSITINKSSGCVCKTGIFRITSYAGSRVARAYRS